MRNGLDVPKNANSRLKAFALGVLPRTGMKQASASPTKVHSWLRKTALQRNELGLCVFSRLLDGDERLLAYNPVETSLRGCVYLDIELTDSVRPRSCTP